MSNKPATQLCRAGQNLLLALCFSEESFRRKKEWLRVYKQSLFSGGGKKKLERTVYSFTGENRRLKVKLENCFKGRSRAGSTLFPMSTGDEAHQPALGFFSKRKTLLCQLHLTEGICWAAGYNTFCLHLLACWGLVTGFFPSVSSSAVHLEVAHILLLPLMVLQTTVSGS